jgi:two-component system chemotaxis response regulator CheY
MFQSHTRILIVDDASIIRTTIRTMLESLGYTDFIEAEDGNKGVESLEASEKPVGLILADQNMPECSGLEFLKKVRKIESHQHTPVILITSENDKDFIIEAIKAGMTAYIHKPITPDELLKKLVFCYTKSQKK